MTEGHKLLETEVVLDNNYPVHPEYVYIVDMKVIRSPCRGTVADLKRHFNAKEVRRCEIFGHDSVRIGDILEEKK